MAGTWCLSMFFSHYVGESMRDMFNDEVVFYFTGQNESQAICQVRSAYQHIMSKEKRVIFTLNYTHC